MSGSNHIPAPQAAGTEGSQNSPRPDAPNPVRDLVDRLNELRGFIAGSDPKLSETIAALANSARQPGRTEDLAYRTHVAYALQDVNRLVGVAVVIPEPLREEMSRLAVSAPGLQNPRLAEMLRDTPRISDRQLVRDIRQAAFEVVKAGGDQDGPDAQGRVTLLEERVRRGAEPRPSEAPKSAPEHGPSADRVHAVASPGEGGRQASPHSAAGAAAASASTGHQLGQGAAVLRHAGVLDRLVSALALPATASSPGEPRPTPISDRIEAFAHKFFENRALETAEASGQRANEALQAFIRGPGAGVLARIQDAARSEPNGIQAVLAEMREGGRYAELRSQFNTALQREESLAAAYDKATAAVRQYGTDRQSAEVVILKRPNDAALAARFERLDAQIGEATAQVPGRQEGRSMTDELGQRVADLARRAVEAVRSLFSRDARLSSAPSPSAAP